MGRDVAKETDMTAKSTKRLEEDRPRRRSLARSTGAMLPR